MVSGEEEEKFQKQARWKTKIKYHLISVRMAPIQSHPEKREWEALASAESDGYTHQEQVYLINAVQQRKYICDYQAYEKMS